MSDEFFAAIALVVGILVAIPTYRWARNKKSKNRVFLEKAQRAGCRTVGRYESFKVLVGNRESNDARFRYDSVQVKYKYTVSGIDYYKTMIFQNQGQVGTDFPDEVEVYYDPQNPRKSVCPQEAHPKQQIQSGCLTTIAITFIAMFLAFHIFRALLG